MEDEDDRQRNRYGEEVDDDERYRRRRGERTDGDRKQRREREGNEGRKDSRRGGYLNADSANLGRSGGVHIPPFKLVRMMEEVEDKSSVEYQRLTWDALRKNLFAALVAVVNTKFPEVGELLLRIILQLKRAYKRNDKLMLKIIAHLVNQQVVHELVALELLTLLLDKPTDDSVEDIFKPDPQFSENEKRYEELKKTILGDDSEDEAASDAGSGDDDDDDDDEEEESDEDEEQMKIKDETDESCKSSKDYISNNYV
ncbi:MIF4G domain-containing protein [Actinidia rufa]|uniref:MIF4G domain-containing protein n=1 Tax=Actinidia rufa TaxID=165716 RepID=A0A7J0GPP0_9ERIC|nr:MIF4G domain-containing protein [Actinidia rufa]